MPLDAASHHHGPSQPPRPLLVRRLDWSRQLLDFCEQRRERPLTWGDQDGVAFAARAIEVMIGYPIWAPTWKGQVGCKQAVEAEGGLCEAWSKRLGPPLHDPRAIRCGDIALVRVPRGSVTAIAFGDDLLCTPLPAGLVLCPKDRAFMGWHVG